MGSVLKFRLTRQLTDIDVHKDARIISCGMQQGQYYVWIDTTKPGVGPRRNMRIVLFATGESFASDHYALFGTIHDHARELCWHVAEQIKDDPEIS